MAEDETLEYNKEALADIFKAFDKSKNGILSKDELPDALRCAGMTPSDQQIEEIIRRFDTNKDGRIQISELVDSYHILLDHSIRGDELLEAFKKFDVNGDGFLRLAELRAVLMKAGEKWSYQEVQKVLTKDFILKYDKNGDGKFDYSEFVDILRDGVFTKPPQEEDSKANITEEFTLQKE